MEDPSFKIAGIKVINVVLNYLYLGLLVGCYILSLGNRPQGAKWGYTIAMIGFAIVTIYMTVSHRSNSLVPPPNSTLADLGLLPCNQGYQ
jgi:hypothetical protein